MRMTWWQTLALMWAICIASASASAQSDAEAGGPPAPHVELEGYPEDIASSRVQEEKRVEKVALRLQAPFQLIVPISRRWTPGQLVRVAIWGGSDELHHQIEAAALEWIGSAGANLHLSFRKTDGSLRTWSAEDRSYRAEIRVGFDQKGRWSLVGADSINSRIKGGAPNETSLNLARFDTELPSDWRGTVIHEFGHALGFEHEHQNPAGACGFRFYDDSGYKRTVDDQGWFTIDAMGRRPGLYTYLGGKANYWKQSEVDRNLKDIKVTSAYLNTGFDSSSIMKYHFESFFFQAGDRSPCYTSARTEALSPADLAGARSVYPHNATREDIVGQELMRQLLFDAKIGSPLGEAIRKHVERVMNR